MSDNALVLFSCPFIRMKVQGDGLMDRIYTSTRTFVPAFHLPLLLAHIEDKKNRAPIWTKRHLILVSHGLGLVPS
jgi:hypothetical protein